jgi:hypothetical protein
MSKAWKKGRGKLGFLQPLLGGWAAAADTPMGPVCCTRVFEPFFKGAYFRLVARWEFDGGSKVYEELALFGVNRAGTVDFWSFTSDGKQSHGTVADASDVHPSAIGFTAEMPAGLARMVYWPDDADGFCWAVESKNAKGWKRFTQHHYHPA